MAKDINITHIDEQPTKDQVGESKKTTLAHEKLFEEYNIRPDKLFDGSILKQIPHEWIPKIIERNIQSISQEFKILEAQHVDSSKVFTLIFDDQETVQKFDEEFNKKMFSNINNFIEGEGENTKKYHRNIVFVQNVEGNKMTISY